MRKYIQCCFSILLPGVFLLMVSCTPGTCLEETESYLKASFYNNDTKIPGAPDTLSVYGLNMDSVLYDKSTKVSKALFPLNASAEKCSFIININGITDTIEFRYSSYPHLISRECGYTFYHHLDTMPEYTKHAIKDIYTGNETITNLNVENIRIFY